VTQGPLSGDPAIAQAISDAKSAGIAVANDAKVFGTAVIGHLSGAATTEIADLESAGASALFDFIPEAYRGLVKMYAGGLITNAENTYNPNMLADIKKWTGYALARIDAFLP
jgi:hypothetical protein